MDRRSRVSVVSSLMDKGDMEWVRVEEQLERHFEADPSLARSAVSFLHSTFGKAMHHDRRKQWLQWLTKKGVPVDGRDSKGRTAIEMLLELLHEEGAAVTEDRWRLLLRCMKQLLELGADIGTENPSTKLTPYEYAVNNLAILNTPEQPGRYERLLTFLEPYKPRKRARISISQSSPNGSAPPVLSDRSTFLECQDILDVTFVVGEERKEVRAHRATLVERSAYFMAQFQGPWRDANAQVLPVEEMDSAVFEVVIKAIFKGKLTSAVVPGDVNIIDLFLALDRFGTSLDLSGLVEVVDRCLRVDNALDVLQSVRACDCQPLTSVCLSYVLKHHCDIIRQPGLDLDSQAAKELLYVLRDHALPYTLRAQGGTNRSV